MEATVFVPFGLIALGYLAEFLLDKEWAEEVGKAFFSTSLIFSIILGLDIRYTVFYAFLALLAASKTKAVYTALFGGLIASVAYFVANPLLSIVPLAIMGLAAPTAFLLNRASNRSHKGVLWTIYMFALSVAISSFILVSMGPLNPYWGILIAAIATWAGRADDSFTLPAYILLPLGFAYAPLPGLVAGFGFSLISSSLAYYLKALDFDGLIGGVVVGTLLYAAAPVLFLTTLVFLMSSAMLGKFADYDERFQKKGKRNAIQVIANGFGASFAAVLIFSGYDALALGIAATAAATADTWATEIGSRSKRNPRLITTLQIVEKGRSGGVTPLGLGASVAAGVFIFLVTYPFYGFAFLIPAILGGVVGSLVDSVFGATSQGIFRCRICGRLTEVDAHCAKPAMRECGVWWFNNDLVNLVSTLIAMAALI